MLSPRPYHSLASKRCFLLFCLSLSPHYGGVMAPTPLCSLRGCVRVPSGCKSPSLAGKWRPPSFPYTPMAHAGGGAGHTQFTRRPLAQD